MPVTLTACDSHLAHGFLLIGTYTISDLLICDRKDEDLDCCYWFLHVFTPACK